MHHTVPLIHLSPWFGVNTQADQAHQDAAADHQHEDPVKHGHSVGRGKFKELKAGGTAGVRKRTYAPVPIIALLNQPRPIGGRPHPVSPLQPTQ